MDALWKSSLNTSPSFWALSWKIMVYQWSMVTRYASGTQCSPSSAIQNGAFCIKSGAFSSECPRPESGLPSSPRFYSTVFASFVFLRSFRVPHSYPSMTQSLTARHTFANISHIRRINDEARCLTPWLHLLPALIESHNQVLAADGFSSNVLGTRGTWRSSSCCNNKENSCIKLSSSAASFFNSGNWSSIFFSLLADSRASARVIRATTKLTAPAKHTAIDFSGVAWAFVAAVGSAPSAAPACTSSVKLLQARQLSELSLAVWLCTCMVISLSFRNSAQLWLGPTKPVAGDLKKCICGL